eukprot:746380-Hanusia_phi.AAC.1
MDQQLLLSSPLLLPYPRRAYDAEHGNGEARRPEAVDEDVMRSGPARGPAVDVDQDLSTASVDPASQGRGGELGGSEPSGARSSVCCCLLPPPLLLSSSSSSGSQIAGDGEETIAVADGTPCHERSEKHFNRLVKDKRRRGGEKRTRRVEQIDEQEEQERARQGEEERGRRGKEKTKGEGSRSRSKNIEVSDVSPLTVRSLPVTELHCRPFLLYKHFSCPQAGRLCSHEI